MVLETARRKNNVQPLRLQDCKGETLSQSCKVLFWVVDNTKFSGVCRECLFKGGSLPFGERKTCSQDAFLIGVPVKSAFALLLTKVTKPFLRKEVMIYEENDKYRGR